jgi:hypothetical protein
VRCVSAGAERRVGVLCVAPAYVVKQTKTKLAMSKNWARVPRREESGPGPGRRAGCNSGFVCMRKASTECTTGRCTRNKKTK